MLVTVTKAEVVNCEQIRRSKIVPRKQNNLTGSIKSQKKGGSRESPNLDWRSNMSCADQAILYRISFSDTHPMASEGEC